jgi:hypothetical protein
MTTAVDQHTIRIRYFTKDNVMALHRKAVLEGREAIATVKDIERLDDNSCYPIFSNTIKNEMSTVVVALNDQGDTLDITLTQDELGALPTKVIQRPY